MYRKVQIKEIASCFNGKTPSKSEQRTNGFPVLKVKNISERGNFKSYESFVDKAFIDKYQKKATKIDDTLILNAAHNSDYVGSKKCIVKDDFCDVIPVGEWLVIRGDTSLVNKRFLYYFLNSTLGHFNIRNCVKGIHLYPKDVAKIQIPLPPLPIQKKIVLVLDKAQELIDLREKQIQLLDDLVQSVYNDMFGDPVSNPMGWEVNYIEKYISFLTSGSRGWAKYYSESGERFIRIQNVRRGRLDFSSNQNVIVPKSKEATRTKVMQNDLIISITADLGRTAVVDEKTALEGAYINQHLCLIRTDGRIDPFYTACFIESPGGIRQIEAKNQEGVKSGLNFNAIKSLKIVTPPLDLQRIFTNKVYHIEAQKALMQQSLQEMKNNYNSLMQRAFKGELFKDETLE